MEEEFIKTEDTPKFENDIPTGKLIAINRRKNEKWQYVELARAFYGSLRFFRIYRIAITVITALLACLVVGFALTEKLEDIAFPTIALVASTMFTVWVYLKPTVEGGRAYLTSVAANGENAVMETRIYEDAVEYWNDDPDERYSLFTSKICNVFETEHLYEIQLKDGTGIVGHMLLKDGFAEGTLEEVKAAVEKAKQA